MGNLDQTKGNKRSKQAIPLPLVGYGSNRYRKPDERIVGWGKYRGQLMSEVPTQYLKWFVRNAYHQMHARKEWAQQELDRRHTEGNDMLLKAKKPSNGYREAL